jgi:hypothetical protein
MKKKLMVFLPRNRLGAKFEEQTENLAQIFINIYFKKKF